MNSPAMNDTFYCNKCSLATTTGSHSATLRATDRHREPGQSPYGCFIISSPQRNVRTMRSDMTFRRLRYPLLIWPPGNLKPPSNTSQSTSSSNLYTFCKPTFITPISFSRRSITPSHFARSRIRYLPSEKVLQDLLGSRQDRAGQPCFHKIDKGNACFYTCSQTPMLRRTSRVLCSSGLS